MSKTYNKTHFEKQLKTQNIKKKKHNTSQPPAQHHLLNLPR